MSLSIHGGMSALMGSQPCLKEGMLMMTMIQNKHDSTVQYPVCVHRPMCCAVLKKVTTPPTPTHTFLKWPFLDDLKKYTHIPPYVVTCLHHEAKIVLKKSEKVPKRSKLAHYELPPRDIHVTTPL